MSSRLGSVGVLPYADEEPAYTRRLTPASRAATSTLSEASMFARLDVIGSFTERGTEVRAARCRTYSASCMAFRTTSMSVTLPLMKVILLRISARLSSLPDERSSRTTTLWPRLTSSSTVFEPMKPAPPVTRYRIQEILLATATAQRPTI